MGPLEAQEVYYPGTKEETQDSKKAKSLHKVHKVY